MIHKYFAQILIGSMFIIFLIVTAIGLYQTSGAIFHEHPIYPMHIEQLSDIAESFEVVQNRAEEEITDEI